HVRHLPHIGRLQHAIDVRGPLVGRSHRGSRRFGVDHSCLPLGGLFLEKIYDAKVPLHRLFPQISSNTRATSSKRTADSRALASPTAALCRFVAALALPDV